MGREEAGRPEPESSRKEGGGHGERTVIFTSWGHRVNTPGGEALMLDFGDDGPKSLLGSPAPTQHRVPDG